MTQRKIQDRRRPTPQATDGAEVERVARAIMKAFADNGKTAAIMSLMPQDAMAAARAALATLQPAPGMVMEPTEEMIQIGCEAAGCGPSWRNAIAAAYRAMTATSLRGQHG